MRTALLTTTLLFLGAGAVSAQDTYALAPGDPAPAFDIAHWVRGTPVTAYQPGRIYVMEFWATWCTPCKTSMPHLSELQRHYGEQVTIIGASDEKLETVSQFLAQPEWVEKAQYTLATDPDRSLHQSYMEAARQDGIPTSFVVGGDGKVQYIGHPMNLDKVLPSVIAGQWDSAAARRGFELERKLDGMYAELRQASGEQRTAALNRLAAAFGELAASNEAVYGSYRVQQFQLLAGPLQRPQEAYALAESIFKHSWDDAMQLNDFAWSIVDPAGKIGERNLEVALKGAARACVLTEYQNAAIVDTLARVHFLRGERAKAIELQEKAVQLAGKDAADYQKALDEYRAAGDKTNA